MPVSDQVERIHHFRQLRNLVLLIDGAPARHGRVDALRQRYVQARNDYDDLIRDLRPTINANQKAMWVENPEKVLEAYAVGEGL